jgi:hypothetical protein
MGVKARAEDPQVLAFEGRPNETPAWADHGVLGAGEAGGQATEMLMCRDVHNVSREQ